MKIKLLSNRAKVPTKGSAAAAGWDLYCATENTIVIPPHQTEMINTDIALEIEEGLWGGIYPRSGLATKQGLRPANCVGVIDSDYRGNVVVALHNDTDFYRHVEPGERIAQLIFHEVIKNDEWQIVGELASTTRGEGGFGSTGMN